MPPFKGKPGFAKKRKKKSRGPIEAAKCRFCREKAKGIDYKDIATLHKLVSGQGKLFSRKRSGNCAMHQRMSMMAIKRARFMALLPFIG